MREHAGNGRVHQSEHHYRQDLALVHDLGFGFHGERCAPGILKLLDPVGRRHGVVLELGCGSGSLTRHLVDAGYHVIATDASAAMLERARVAVPAADIRQLVLPDDPLPPVDAVVGVGHVLNYLVDEAAVIRAVLAVAAALRPGGVLAVDVVDLSWLDDSRNMMPMARVTADWAIVSKSSTPRPRLLVHDMTTFVRTGDDSWRRADERHDNILLDAAQLVALLGEHGITARVGTSFGAERLPTGLVTITGHRGR